MSVSYVKDPDATLDYVVDWSAWLQAGEAVATSVMVVSNTAVNGLTLGPAPAGGLSITNDTTTATVWLSGGLVGRTYSVVNTVTTDMGRTEVQSIVIKVQQR